MSAAGFRVIAPDNALPDHLSLKRFHVGGFSMGGTTAARLLALGPSRVDAAVLAGVTDYILEGEFMQRPENFPPPRIVH